MALEKPTQQGMPVKQKATIGALVVVVLIVIWQIIGLMGGSGNSTPPSAEVNPVPPKAPVRSSAGAPQSGMSATSASATAMSSQAAQQAELRQAQVMSDSRFLELQQASEQKYLGKINDLEDLKIQRAIAETNQAIAAAKLATVTAEKNISDLLTKPAAPEVPAGAYANKLTNPALQGEAVAGQGPPSAPAQETQYTVISVSMQLGKWSAVIGAQGKLYNVSVGDVLSADGSVVENISKSGVILRKDGKTKKVSITTAI